MTHNRQLEINSMFEIYGVFEVFEFQWPLKQRTFDCFLETSKVSFSISCSSFDTNDKTDRQMLKSLCPKSLWVIFILNSISGAWTRPSFFGPLVTERLLIQETAAVAFLLLACEKPDWHFAASSEEQEHKNGHFKHFSFPPLLEAKIMPKKYIRKCRLWN